MKTENKFVSNSDKCSPIHTSFLIFSSILTILSAISLIAYTIYMHYTISLVITIYSVVSLSIFVFASVALKTSNRGLYSLAAFITTAFVILEPVSVALIGMCTKINSLYTYAFSLLVPTFVFVAIANLLFCFRKEQTNVNTKLFYKALFVCLIVTIGILCGTNVLRYDSVFSLFAAIVAYFSPLSIFLPIVAQRKRLFIIIKILNIILLLGLFVFYVDMFLTIFDVTSFNLGVYSQIYKLYSVLHFYVFGPEHHAWICTLFVEAIFEILYPIVLIVNISICNNRLAHFKKSKKDVQEKDKT